MDERGGAMKKLLAVLFVFVIILSCIQFIDASDSRPITFNDFIRIKRLSDPQLSPQGDKIAYVITSMDKATNTSNSDIWIQSADGGQPWQLTSSPKSDANPRWSPDGKKIAFISTRKGVPQVWMIEAEGGESYPVTDISTGASGVIWSPEGDHLAFISSVYPDCADDACNRKRNDEKKKSLVKAQIYHELLFRHWNSWRDDTRSHVFVIPSEGGKARDLSPGEFDVPPISLGSSNDYTFSPDGKEICFVRNTDPELKLGLGTNNDLFISSVQGGEIIKITENRANDNSPHYSPDGRYIAYRAMRRPGFEADKYCLMLYDRKTKQIKNLTEKLDVSVVEIIWSDDNSDLYVTYGEKGRTVLARVSIKEQDVERILDGHTINSLQLSPDGGKFFFLKQGIHSPSELYSFDLASKILTPITNTNGPLLAELAMNPVEEFWFDGANDDKVHGFLLKPPLFDPGKKYPLVMLIHGGPQGAWHDNYHYRWNAQMFASPGYVVAMVNFHGSTGYGQDFTDSISGDWGGKPYKDIMLGLDYLLSHCGFIDRDKIGAAGASYGGYMINWIEGHTDRFSCLISHAGVFDLRSMYGSTEELWFPEWEFQGTPWTNPEQYKLWSPSFYIENFRTPCLVIHGQYDFRLPVTQGFQFFTALQRMDVPSKLLYFPDEGHFVTKPQNAELWWETVHEWLAKYLSKSSQ
jgi:dipeptidyl aminopeptidase/acylaminoacyl peptidase